MMLQDSVEVLVKFLCLFFFIITYWMCSWDGKMWHQKHWGELCVCGDDSFAIFNLCLSVSESSSISDWSLIFHFKWITSFIQGFLRPLAFIKHSESSLIEPVSLLFMPSFSFTRRVLVGPARLSSPLSLHAPLAASLPGSSFLLHGVYARPQAALSLVSLFPFSRSALDRCSLAPRRPVPGLRCTQNANIMRIHTTSKKCTITDQSAYSWLYARAFYQVELHMWQPRFWSRFRKQHSTMDHRSV